MTVLPARAGGPHGDLDVVVATPGYFGHAESLVEALGAAVDGEHVKDEILAFLPGLVDECADEAGTDAVGGLPAGTAGGDCDSEVLRASLLEH